MRRRRELADAEPHRSAERGTAIGRPGVERPGRALFTGPPGDVLVSDLPNEIEGVDAVGQNILATSSNSLTDREVMELILFGTPEDIRAASPLMNEDQKRMVLKSIGPEKISP